MNNLKNKAIQVLAYGFGGIMLLGGLSMALSDSFLGGLFMIFSGLSIFPYFWRFIRTKFKRQLPAVWKLVMFFVFMIISAFFMPEIKPEDKLDMPKIASNEAQNNTDVEQAEANVEDTINETNNKIEDKVREVNPVSDNSKVVEPKSTLLDDLWTDVDNSIHSRKGIDVSYDTTLKAVTLTYTGDSYWDENDTVREAYKKLVQYGTVAFKRPEVESVVIEIKSTLVDTYGNESIMPVVIIEMLKDDFNKFNWENLKMLPVSDQIESKALRYYVHPALKKNLSKDKLYLSY